MIVESKRGRPGRGSLAVQVTCKQHDSDDSAACTTTPRGSSPQRHPAQRRDMMGGAGATGLKPFAHLDQLPFPPGDAPPELTCSLGCEPYGQWRYFNPKATVGGHLITCPCCCQGWAALVPDPADPTDYMIFFEAGCSRGCPPEELVWWLAWRLGERPPAPPPDERERRYCRACCRRLVGDLEERPADQKERLLAHTAYESGRWAARERVDLKVLTRALLNAARPLPPDTARRLMAPALAKGLGNPREVRRHG